LILAIVGLCRLDPALGQYVSDGTRKRLVALASAGVLHGHDVVEREMTRS
jgi:hypothetical protein